MKEILSFFAVFLIFSSVIMAQENGTGTIKGTVSDHSSGEPIMGVSIRVNGTGKIGVTDKDGNFLISGLEPGVYALTFSFIGFIEQTISNVRVLAGETTHQGNVTLEESSLTLKEVVVTPGSYAVMGTAPLSRQTLTEKDLKNMSFAEDITRAVSRLPGVSSNDFSSKFTVRGGETDEVLITLDGMELYEPFHQRDFAGGLFSIVDIETIQGVELLTGGFSAQYGDRQSAVFAMSTKSNTDNRRHSSVGLSIINARLYTDGVFAKNKGSYLFSARKGLLDQTFKLIGQNENIPKFYDMMVKTEYKLNAKHTLSFHALQAGDKTAVRDIVPYEIDYDIHDTKYDNTYGWLTLESTYNQKLDSRTLLFAGFISHTRNGNAYKTAPSDKVKFTLLDKRDYSFFGLKQDWNWDVSDWFLLKFGYVAKQLGARYHYALDLDDIRINSEDSLVHYIENVDLRKNPAGQQASAYVSARFKALPGLFIEPGLRYDFASYTGDNLWSPRLGVAYAISENTFLRGAWGYYYQTQFINNLDVNHGADTFNPAELSKHYVVGIEHLFSNGLSLRLEGYYKDISNISPTYQNLRDQWEVFPEARNDVVKLNIGQARAKGIELFLKYDTGDKISWWFSYALAKAEEKVESVQFEGLLDKRTGWLPKVNNQKHTIYVDLNYRLNEGWLFNLSWQYYVGWPLTKYEYDFKPSGPDDSLDFYARHTTFRGEQYPAYHRMDLRINRHFNFEKSKLSAYLHIINLYNRENLRKFDLDVRNDQEKLVPDGKGGYVYFRDDKYWLGLTPVIGISWEF